MMLTREEIEQWREDELAAMKQALAALREERDEALRNLRIQTERVVGDAERKRYEQMRAALERSLPHVPDFVADEVRAALAATGEENERLREQVASGRQTPVEDIG